MEFFERVLISLYFMVKTANAVCADGDLTCSYWESINECQINPGYFVPLCPYSCSNPCECPVHTEDTACDCLLRAKNGECETNPTLLNSICKTTCDIRSTTSCPTLSAPVDANARLSTTSTFYLTTVDEECNPGWEKVNKASKGRKLCGKDGTWLEDKFFDQSVECKRVDCGDPQDTLHGTKVYTSTLYESTVSYTCDLGYKRESGDLIRTCNETAQWSGSLPQCKVITCPGPPVVQFSDRTGSSNVYNSDIEYVCHTGYNHSYGDLHRRCQLNGEWSGTHPVCTIIYCPEPVDVTHTSLSYTETHYLSRATYMCLIGYNYTSGDLIRVCQENQTWSGEEPVCTIISCGEPPLFAGAKTNASGFNYSDTVVYECYIQEDEENIVQWSQICTEDGEWRGDEGKCAAIRRKFEATPVEASGSVAFGTVAMSILIVILLCIIILDIPTVVIQSRYLRRNVKNFRKVFRSTLQDFYKKRWARRRVSLDDIREVCKADQESINMSTMSIQTVVDADDDGLRMETPVSQSLRGGSSCRTSLTSLPPDFSPDISDLPDITDDVVISDPPTEHTLSEKARPDNAGVLVKADIEIHNLD